MINTQGPERRRVPAAARRAPASGGRTSRRRGTRAASAPRSPTRPGGRVLSIASVLWLFRDGPRPDGPRRRARSCSACGARGGWPRCIPSNRARIAALLVYAALPLVPGVISTGRLVGALRLRRGAVVRPPPPRRRRHRHRRPRRGRRTTCVDGVLGLAIRERVRRTALLAVVTALAVALAPAVLPVVVVVTVVLGLDQPRRRRRPAHRRPGSPASGSPASRRWPGCSTCRGRRRGRGTTSPRRRSPARPAGASLDVASMAIGQGRFEVLSLALYVPVARRPRRRPGVAPDVGGPRRRARSSCSSASPCCRTATPCRSPSPTSASCSCRSALGLALSAAASVAAFGEDVAGRTFGWRQPLGLLAIGAVAVGVVPGPAHAHRRRVVRPPRQPRRGGRGRPLPPAADGRRLPRAVPRRSPADPVPVRRPRRRRGDGARRRRRHRPRATAGRSPTAPPTTPSATPCARSPTAARCRGGRLLAPFGIRYVVVPLIDGASSTASEPLPAAGRAARRARRPSSTSSARSARPTSPASRTGAP